MDRSRSTAFRSPRAWKFVSFLNGCELREERTWSADMLEASWYVERCSGCGGEAGVSRRGRLPLQLGLRSCLNLYVNRVGSHPSLLDWRLVFLVVYSCLISSCCIRRAYDAVLLRGMSLDGVVNLILSRRIYPARPSLRSPFRCAFAVSLHADEPHLHDCSP